jgi:hypothetical protein
MPPAEQWSPGQVIVRPEVLNDGRAWLEAAAWWSRTPGARTPPGRPQPSLNNAAAADMSGCGSRTLFEVQEPSKVVMPAKRGGLSGGDAPDGIRTRATALKGP